jgi:signal transduction histidine kinase
MTLSHDSEMITLAITDNGIGFSPPDFTEAVPLKGAGLIGMIERLEMVNGILLIESKLEHGSCLKAVIPYSREDN